MASGSQVIELRQVSGLAAAVVALYDRVTSDSDTSTSVGEELRRLRGLPRPGGRIGNDIARVLDGQTDAAPGEVAAAIERLRDISARWPTRPSQRRSANPRRHTATAGTTARPGTGHEQLGNL